MHGIAERAALLHAMLSTAEAVKGLTAIMKARYTGLLASAALCLSMAVSAQKGPAEAPSVHHIPASPELNTKVNLSLGRASLRKTVRALSETSGIYIRLDGVGDEDAQITIVARQIAFASVLEAIANQCNLMIAPSDNGILLEEWPTLDVNGNKKQFVGPNAPWSDEWDRPEVVRKWQRSKSVSARQSGVTVTQVLPSPATVQGGPTDPVVGGPDTQARPGSSVTLAPSTTPLPTLQSGQGPETGVPLTLQNPGGQPLQPGQGPATTPPVFTGQPAQLPGQDFQANPGAPGQPGFAPPTPAPGFQEGFPGMGSSDSPRYALRGTLSLMVTALSERSFVIAEPGLGPKGEVGVYLTVYRLEGNSLREVSSVFHKSANQGAMGFRSMGSGPFGKGGGFGGNFGGGQDSKSNFYPNPYKNNGSDYDRKGPGSAPNPNKNSPATPPPADPDRGLPELPSGPGGPPQALPVVPSGPSSPPQALPPSKDTPKSALPDTVDPTRPSEKPDDVVRNAHVRTVPILGDLPLIGKLFVVDSNRSFLEDLPYIGWFFPFPEP